MHSGWERHVKSCRHRNAHSDETMHFPGFHLEAAQMLMERDVSGLAVDTMFTDRENSVGFAVHYAWLPRGRWH
jgi:kynurenine formamidase